MRKQPWRIGFVKRFEQSLLGNGMLVLIHDGSKEKPTDQMADPSYYTKRYRLILDSEPVNTVVKFVYNMREGWADFDIYYHKFPMGKTIPIKEVAGKVQTTIGRVQW